MAAIADETRTAMTRRVESSAIDPIRETFSRDRTALSTLASSPGNDEWELCTHVKALFGRARSHRRPLVARWTRAYEILHNRTWGRPHPYMPNPELPEIFPILESWVGWMTDQAPTFVVAPVAPPGSQHHHMWSLVADDLQWTMQAGWQLHNFDMAVNRVLWDACTFGTGFFKAVWDASLLGGKGDAKLLRVDPYSFYPDPAATSMEDSSYFIEVRRMSVQELDRKWPGSAKLVGHSDIDEEDASPNRLRSPAMGQPPRANPGAIAPNTSNAYGLPGQTDRAAVSDGLGVTVFEAWLRQHKHETTTDEETGEKRTRTVESWRMVVIAGNRVIRDRLASEMFSHGRHPYERYVLTEEGEFWGQSMVDLLASAQISVNRLLAAMEHNLWLMGNPVFVESTRAGTDRVRMTNRAGTRIRVNESTDGVKWMAPPQMGEQMGMGMVQFYSAKMKDISGLTGINLGNMPTGRNSEGTLDTVQEAGFVRVRKALRELRGTLRRTGELIASMIVEFYDEPRAVSMLGENELTRHLGSMHFYLPGPEGNLPMRFQLLVDSDSFISDEQRRNTALTLLGLGTLDDEAVLEVFRWPNRDRIVARVRELKAAQILEPPGARQRARA